MGGWRECCCGGAVALAGACAATVFSRWRSLRPLLWRRVAAPGWLAVELPDLQWVVARSPSTAACRCHLLAGAGAVAPGSGGVGVIWGDGLVAGTVVEPLLLRRPADWSWRNRSL